MENVFDEGKNGILSVLLVHETGKVVMKNVLDSLKFQIWKVS